MHQPPFVIGRPEYDVCSCGDFRKDHDKKGCVLCRTLGNGTCGEIPPCKKFQLATLASRSEVERQDELDRLLEEALLRHHNCWDTFSAGDIPMENSTK